jgi:hypothetical protein
MMEKNIEETINRVADGSGEIPIVYQTYPNASMAVPLKNLGVPKKRPNKTDAAHKTKKCTHRAIDPEIFVEPSFQSYNVPNYHRHGPHAQQMTSIHSQSCVRAQYHPIASQLQPPHTFSTTNEINSMKEVNEYGLLHDLSTFNADLFSLFCNQSDPGLMDLQAPMKPSLNMTNHSPFMNDTHLLPSTISSSRSSAIVSQEDQVTSSVCTPPSFQHLNTLPYTTTPDTLIYHESFMDHDTDTYMHDESFSVQTPGVIFMADS